MEFTLKKDQLISELMYMSNTILKLEDHKTHADTNDCEFCNLSQRMLEIANEGIQ